MILSLETTKFFLYLNIILYGNNNLDFRSYTKENDMILSLEATIIFVLEYHFVWQQ
jgi:hypothetical protein